MKFLFLSILIGSIAALDESQKDLQEVATSRASSGCKDSLPVLHRDCKKLKLSCPKLKSQCNKTLKQVVGSSKSGKQCQKKIRKGDANKKIHQFCAGSCTMCKPARSTPAPKPNTTPVPETTPAPKADDICKKTTCTQAANEQCSDCPADACLRGSQCIHYNPKWDDNNFFTKQQFFQGCIANGGTDCSEANLETTTTDQPRPTPEPKTTPAPEADKSISNHYCETNQWQCQSGDECIKLEYRCDEHPDCIDESDEVGCAIHCLWGEWGQWTECTKTCGLGEKERTRQIKQESMNGGMQCNGDPKWIEYCEIKSCSDNDTGSKISCTWSEDCPLSKPYCRQSMCYECIGNGDCSSQKPYCSANQCIECLSSSDCQSDEKCIDSACHDWGCNDDSECGPNEYCRSRQCYTNEKDRYCSGTGLATVDTYTTLDAAIAACEKVSSCSCIWDGSCDGVNYSINVGTSTRPSTTGTCTWLKGRWQGSHTRF
jgi:hypothetical protein